MSKKIVLVTGVNGGIGGATAALFRKNGWQVIGTDRQDSSAVCDRYVKADISDPTQNRDIFEGIASAEKRLDALVNNAAMQICKPIVDTSVEEWDAVMAANLRAVFLSVKHSFELLRASKGAVVNVSSVHAVATSPGIAAYAASKGGLSAFTRSIAVEWAPFGIRSNAVLPGAVDTPMLRAGFERGHLQGSSVEEQLITIGKKHPIGRVAQPAEIGAAIYFLADNELSSFITGQELFADGGALAKLSTE